MKAVTGVVEFRRKLGGGIRSLDLVLFFPGLQLSTGCCCLQKMAEGNGEQSRG